MRKHDYDRFQIRPGAPKRRGDAFVNQVLRQTNKAGAKLGKTVGKGGQRPGARLGRGHVAARFAGGSLTPNARRVTIKTRLVNLANAGPRTTAAHLRYIEREGVDRHGGAGRAMARQPMPRTSMHSRSAARATGTNSASSCRRRTQNCSTACGSIPGT